MELKLCNPCMSELAADVANTAEGRGGVAAATSGLLLTPLHHSPSLRYAGERNHQYACNASICTMHG